MHPFALGGFASLDSAGQTGLVPRSKCTQGLDRLAHLAILTWQLWNLTDLLSSVTAIQDTEQHGLARIKISFMNPCKTMVKCSYAFVERGMCE